jgi:PST family polysaccharide transporter
VVVAAQAASQLVTLAVLAVLYRRVGVESFGLLGMVTPLLVLVRVFVSSGLDVAAVQRAELSDRQVSALFWINQGLGLAMAALVAAAAPLLVWFYGKDLLLPLTLALAGTSIVHALGMQHQALMQRRLRLGRLALIRLAALSLGGVAGIVAALAGWGVWALVAQQYVELASLAALAWWAEPWRPGLAYGRLRTPHAPREGVRHAERDACDAGPLVRFGGFYTLSSLMFYLVGNVDRILIGYVLGAKALGLYGQARNLMMKPVGIVLTPLTGIMLPALSRAAHDRGLYVRLLLGFSRFIALTMLPAAVGLAIVAPEAMRVLGGPQWTDAGPVLAILALALLVQGFFDALGSVLASAGRADRLAYASIVIAIVLSASFATGLTLGRRTGEPPQDGEETRVDSDVGRIGNPSSKGTGLSDGLPIRPTGKPTRNILPALQGVALGYSASMLLLVFPCYLIFALRTVGVAPRDWLGQLFPAAPAAGLMGLVVAACHGLLGIVWRLSDPALLAVEVLVGATVYLCLVRRDIAWLLRQGLPSRSPKDGQVR